MTSEPLVSVIVPCFNGLPYVLEAVASIEAQDYGHWELVVVDDGSTDGSAAAIRAACPRAVVHVEPHAGVGAARNRGIERARGEVLAFLDADDIARPHRLRLGLAALASGVDTVFGAIVQFQIGPGGLRRDRPPQPGVAATGCMMTRDAAARLGPFDESLRGGEFIEWWSRAAGARVTSVTVPEVIGDRRIHDRNMGRDPASRLELLRAVRASMARREGGA
ncbi:MAG: glycosyltransferase family 2 protein [Dehalococcoidia bacterium]